MTARPGTSPLIATDATLGTGTESALSPRLDPGAGVRARGLLANTRAPARWFNFFLGLLGDWISYLDGRAPTVTVHTATAAGNAIPANVVEIEVAIEGGGGGGASGAGTGNNNGSNGGGSGRVYRTRIPRALVGDTYDVTIGAGGTGGAGGVTGATNANVGTAGGFSAITFAGPGGDTNKRVFVQAAGGSPGNLTTGGSGYSGGGGAGENAVGAGHGGALGGAGEDGSGVGARLGGAGDTGVSYLGTATGAGCLGGAAGADTGASGLIKGAGGGGGAIAVGTPAPAGSGSAAGAGIGGGGFTNGGFSGQGYGAGGGGGGQGTSGSGAGANGVQGVAVVTFHYGAT